MQINNLQIQKMALGKAFDKRYDELFSSYLKNISEIQKTTNKKTDQSSGVNSVQDMQASEQKHESIQKAADKFYKEQKYIRNIYEQEKYKLDIQEAPSIHTMISASNRKQKLMIDNMNEQIESAKKALKDKISNGNYNFLEQIELKRDFEKFQNNLKYKISKEISGFKSSYHDALVNKNIKEIDRLEKSLLTDLLSQI
jgi:hypothetical protein